MEKTTFTIAVLPGDGIGPEVIASALCVLRALEAGSNSLQFRFEEYPAGAGEYLRSGNPLPPATLEGCRAADAILLGAMGLPHVRWADGTEMAPQIDLREILDLYAGIRPIYLYNASHSPLKRYAAAGIDLLLVRESTEGMFASRKASYAPDAVEVRDTLLITRAGAERVCRTACELARKRRHKVTLVDKANVLPSMAFLRRIFDEVASAYPDLETERIYVDAAALYLVQQPHRFDVMVMENLFGDILSDLAAGLIGGMGMAPSADIGERYAVFQPSHGTAPDIAGREIANPVATILSSAMMLEWLGGDAALRGAARIRAAVAAVCSDSANATPDLGGKLSTAAVTGLIVAALAS